MICLMGVMHARAALPSTSHSAGAALAKPATEFGATQRQRVTQRCREAADSDPTNRQLPDRPLDAEVVLWHGIIIRQLIPPRA